MDCDAWVRGVMEGLNPDEKEAVIHAFLGLTKKRVQAFKAGRGNKVFKHRGEKYMSASPVYYLLQLAAVSRVLLREGGTRDDIMGWLESQCIPISLPQGMSLATFCDDWAFIAFLSGEAVLHFPEHGGAVVNPLYGNKMLACGADQASDEGYIERQAKFVEGRLAAGAKMIGMRIITDSDGAGAVSNFEMLRQWALLVRVATLTFGLSRRFVSDKECDNAYATIPDMSRALWTAVSEVATKEGVSAATRKALELVTAEQVVLDWKVQDVATAHVSEGDGTGAIFARDDRVGLEVSGVFDRKKRVRLAKRQEDAAAGGADLAAVTVNVSLTAAGTAAMQFTHTAESGDRLFAPEQVPETASERLRAAMACARGSWGAIAHAIKNKKVLVTRDPIAALTMQFRNAPYILVGEQHTFIMKA